MQAIIDAEPSELTQLLVQKASKSNTAHLIHDKNLEPSTRELAESYLALSLNHWQQNLSANSSTVQALRELLAQHQQRLQDLATAGLDFGSTTPYVQNEMPPSKMFRPESSVLSLIGRERELLALHSWCSHEVTFAITAHAAPGGTGKTRLALQLIHELQQQGWLAALVDQHEVLRLLATTKLPKNILLVLDYADYRSAELETLLAVTTQLISANHTVRLLLLARPDGGWWNDIYNVLMGSTSLYKQLKFLPPALIALPPPKAPNKENKLQILQQVAKAAQLQLPSDADEFQIPANSTPLMWMMAAYRFLQPNRQPHTEQVTELCKQMVMRHERDYIKQKLNNKDNLDAAMQALALFTFAGGVSDQVDREACEKLVYRVTQLAARPAETWPIANTLKSVYPTYMGISSLRPDLLGEYLCEEILSDQLLQVFAQWIITQIRNNFHDDKRHVDWLLPLIDAHQTCERVQQWQSSENNLPERWRNTLQSLSFKDIQALASVDTQKHLLLRDLMVLLSGQALRTAGGDPVRQAEVLNNRSVYLSAIGDRKGAMKSIKQSTERYRKAATINPLKFTPHLAGSLNNLASHLADLGHHEDASKAAQESVDLRRSLVKTQPETHTRNLAASLNNLSPILSEIDKSEDAINAAQEATQLFRLLVTKRSDAFKPDLSASLYNLAVRQTESGNHEAALTSNQESVKLRRSLAEKKPDTFTSELAAALNNLSTTYWELGRHEDALKATQEAVKLRRFLAKQRPDLFTIDLAESLNNLAVFLSTTGERIEALNAARNAAALYRDVARHRPDIFTPNLAISLETLTRRLSESGHATEACKTSVEATTLFSKMWRKHPSSFEKHLGMRVHDTLQLYVTNGRTVQDAINDLNKDKNTADFLRNKKQ